MPRKSAKPRMRSSNRPLLVPNWNPDDETSTGADTVTGVVESGGWKVIDTVAAPEWMGKIGLTDP